MTHADSIPPAWKTNVRDVGANRNSRWLRPNDAAVSSYAQPWDDQLAEEDLYRDPSWRAADAKDLIALALWGIPVVVALTAAALL